MAPDERRWVGVPWPRVERNDLPAVSILSGEPCATAVEHRMRRSTALTLRGQVVVISVPLTAAETERYRRARSFRRVLTVALAVVVVGGLIGMVASPWSGTVSVAALVLISALGVFVPHSTLPLTWTDGVQPEALAIAAHPRFVRALTHSGGVVTGEGFPGGRLPVVPHSRLLVYLGLAASVLLAVVVAATIARSQRDDQNDVAASAGVVDRPAATSGGPRSTAASTATSTTSPTSSTSLPPTTVGALAPGSVPTSYLQAAPIIEALAAAQPPDTCNAHAAYVLMRRAPLPLTIDEVNRWSVDVAAVMEAVAASPLVGQPHLLDGSVASVRAAASAGGFAPAWAATGIDAVVAGTPASLALPAFDSTAAGQCPPVGWTSTP